MTLALAFSWSRWVGIIVKEFIQLRRDRLTFGMIIGIPVMQLILFGYAINADPKHLPTAVLAADASPYSRSLLAAMQNSGYFRIDRQVTSEDEAEDLLAHGHVQFVVTIPEDFGSKLVRGERPVLLVEADASDPAATGNAIAALGAARQYGARARPAGAARGARIRARRPFDVRVHRRYNPEGVTAYNIVPGLHRHDPHHDHGADDRAGDDARARARHLREPAVDAGAADRGDDRQDRALHHDRADPGDARSSPPRCCCSRCRCRAARCCSTSCVLLFIAANLTLGITFSSIARNQLQAMQMTFFFFLPSILLSGFMFPFRGMPEWAQWIGSVLPLTHFLLLVRGIMLKGNDAGRAAGRTSGRSSPSWWW